MSEAVTNPFNFCVRFIKISILYLFPAVSAGFFVCFHGEDTVFSPHTQELCIDRKFQCQAAAKLDLCSILSASWTMFAVWMREEDIQDFRPLRPGPDPPEIVVLFLCPISITLSISLLRNYWAFPDSP